MAKKKKKRRIRAEIKMYACLFSLLASMVTMMVLLKQVDEVVVSIDNVSQSGEKEIIVALDPGHGGYDSGSVFNETYEKDITLSIAKKTGAFLTNKGIKVVYTRSSDIALAEYENADLQARIDFGINEKASYFVSMHLNESPSAERSSGFEVFQSSTSEKSIFLAEQMSDTLDALNYTQRRDILEGTNLHVIAFNPVPAVLVEMGFLDDDEDRAYVMSAAGQQAIATAIGESIIKSINNFN